MKLCDFIDKSFPIRDQKLNGYKAPYEIFLERAEKLSLLEEEIPEIIESFFHNLQSTLREKNDFDLLGQALEKMGNTPLRKIVIDIIARFLDEILESTKEAHEQLVKNIEDKVSRAEKFSKEDCRSQYAGLLNIYGLIHYDILKLHKLSPYHNEQFVLDTKLRINTLVIANKFPRNFNYCGITFNGPLYPIETENAIPLRRGIKDSQQYYPYKKAKKIDEGDTGNEVFMATNGEKIIYIRVLPKLSRAQHKANAILASKIGTYVSKKNFSSERLLSNGLGASRKLDQYHPMAKPKGEREKEEIFLNKITKVIPGTGVIDEVLSFVSEGDRNIENFGISLQSIDEFSTEKFEDVFLCKIDFDRCNFFPLEDESEYEKNILANALYKRHFGDKNKVKDDPAYIEEQLRTRLKLSLLTSKFVSGLVDKAHFNEDEKELTIEEVIRRRDMAFSLFRKETKTSFMSFKNTRNQFLKNHPQLLNELFTECADYVFGHFDEDKCEAIIRSMATRMMEVREKLGIKNPVCDIESVISNARKKYASAHDHEKVNVHSRKKGKEKDKRDNSIAEEQVLQSPNKIESAIQGEVSAFLSECIGKLDTEINARKEAKKSCWHFFRKTDTTIKQAKYDLLKDLHKQVLNRKDGWLDQVKNLRQDATLIKTTFPNTFFGIKLHVSRSEFALNRIQTIAAAEARRQKAKK